MADGNSVRTRLISGAGGLLLALALGALIMALQGYRPWGGYRALFSFSIGSPSALATTLTRSMPLVLTGLSASLAFGSGPVNLGQPGQLVMGALAATVAGLFVDLPPLIMLPFTLMCAAAGGAAWAGLAALFRLAFGMSEFITTLMLNMIADFFALWAISGPLYDTQAFSPMTPRIVESAWLPRIGDLSTGVFVMALAFLLLYVVSRRTVAGYEWRIHGNNRLFARLGGVPVDRSYVWIMLCSGALAGLAGGLVLLSGPRRFIKGLGANYAWDGVMIAVVAANNLPDTLVFGLFFAALQTGSLGMELITAIPSEFVLVLQAIIVLVIVGARRTLTLLVARLEARRTLESVPSVSSGGRNDI